MPIPFHLYKQKIGDADFDDDPYLDPHGPAAAVNVEQDKPLLPPKAGRYRGRATVVFDLDETLVYSRDGPLFGRPGLQALLAFTCLFFETVVWTAGTREYAEAVVRSIDPSGAIQYCVYRHDKWYQEDGPKDLRLLGRDLNDVIMIENNPDCIRGSEANCILVDDYEGPADRDVTLYAVKELLEELTVSRDPVPAFLPQSRHLRQRPVLEADPTWQAFFLEPNSTLRTPWNLDFVPRLGWAFHLMTTTIHADGPERPAHLDPDPRGRWLTQPAQDPPKTPATDPLAPIPKKSAASPPTGRQRGRPRTGKPRRKRGSGAVPPPRPPTTPSSAVARAFAPLRAASDDPHGDSGRPGSPILAVISSAVAFVWTLCSILRQ
jgi:RNA polymerase II subunit A small phosphatase-like protein